MFPNFRMSRGKRFTSLHASCTMLLLLTAAACLNDETLISDEKNQKNLISNSSFEIDNKPTLQGWVADSARDNLVKDAPPQGGQWSIKLEAGWAPQEGFAETYYSGDTGKNIYRLTVWIKTLHQWDGTISLGLKKSGQTIIRKSASRDSPQWSQLSLQDTLSVSRADSIIIRLSAGITEVRRGEARFDLVRLERVPIK